ncbi:cadherin-like protein 26 isoform X1 [Rhineura floridana]|uniref:cadherin-like protein 26 isoform X1 n=1 Tax=Rhineura floridana TaxID=261503 RepID=UPI002AC82902|nr:cadherin-like protein 26 isoform X1 [Rhineura floridana]
MPIRSGFFPAAARPRISRAVPLLLAVLAINCFHHALGDNGSLRKTTHKRSSQDLKLQDSLRPLRRTKRRWVITTLELEEEDKGPFPKPIGELFNDVAQDMSVKYLISGPGVDEYPEVGLFSIEDDANGHVYVHRSIDRERNPSFTIRFDVANRMSGEIVDRSLLFNVKIKDVNDNAPEFPKKEFSITMKENHNRDEPVFNVTAFDKDEEGTPNSRVAYSLVLQTPNPKEPVFTIDSSSGQIRVTGCSHYETARAFRLLIKATDHGNPRLSSTATINIAMEDSNNNMPVFVKENYHLDVPEGKTEHGILRLSVEDKDSPSTPAWRAKYEILGGDVAKNFIIETDPNTNEGVLSIAKPLIYDKNNERRLVISVENEEPLSLCERGRVQSAQVLQKAYVNINIIDENDAPQFHPTILVLRQEEGMMPGTRIVQYTARDPDTTSNIIRYKVASDPDGWVTVDENSGIVTTVKMLDRESPHVNNSLYTIVIHAIDDGVPPLTGTGTIQLYLSDLNDNAPVLVTPFLVACDGKEKGPFLIKAEDNDSHPYAGPFTFHLVKTSGNVQSSWKLGESFGDSVELFMLKNLPAGNYSVQLHILDKQGLSRDQSLHVRVCRCLDGITCEQEMKLSAVSVGLGGGAIAAILSGVLLLLLALALLLWCSLTSEREKGSPFIPYEEGNQTLIHYNEESQRVLSQDTPDVGDPAISSPVYAQISKEKAQTMKMASGATTSHSQTSSQVPYEQNPSDFPGMNHGQAKLTENSYHPGGSIASPVTILEDFHPIPGWHQQVTLLPQSSKMHWKKPHDRILEMVGEILNQKRDRIASLEDNMVSYCPHVYAAEGKLEKSESFWSLPVVDDENNSLPPDFLETLGPKFTNLGRICSK